MTILPSIFNFLDSTTIFSPKNRGWWGPHLLHLADQIMFNDNSDASTNELRQLIKSIRDKLIPIS